VTGPNIKEANMFYDTLKSILGSSSIVNLHDAGKLQRQAELIDEIEIELDVLEQQLAEWECVCGVYEEEAA
jgi:hypothetical protein